MSFAVAGDPVVVTLRDADSPEVVALDLETLPTGTTLCLWNKSIAPYVERIKVPSSSVGTYYRLDESKMPVLEFAVSRQIMWRGKPGLIQERLYGVLENKEPEFGKWFAKLTRWLRKNFRKNPTTMGGYVGPAAYDWFEKGGYLLPGFLPPDTDAWVQEIEKQHP